MQETFLNPVIRFNYRTNLNMLRRDMRLHAGNFMGS